MNIFVEVPQKKKNLFHVIKPNWKLLARIRDTFLDIDKNFPKTKFQMVVDGSTAHIQ